MIVFGAFVIALVFFVPKLLTGCVACRIVVPIASLHCLWASDIEIGFAGLRDLVIFSFMWTGFIAWSVETFG